MDHSPRAPGFIPLHACEHNSLLGYRSDALAADLFDEAMQRQHAALGLLCALSGTSFLNELSEEPLDRCMQAIRLLCSDATGLYSAAWGSMLRNAT